MEWLSDPQAWIALVTLTALEVVLGVDNIIFISILVGRLPEHQRQRARGWDSAFAMFDAHRPPALARMGDDADAHRCSRIPVLGKAISGRDLILIGGGLFLLWKSVHEIHNSLEGEEENEQRGGRRARGLRRGASCRSRSSTSFSRSIR